MHMSSDLQFKIYEDFLHYFLPYGLLDFFEPVKAEQKTHINPTTKAQVPALLLYIDERDNLTEETQDYSPKGFNEETVLNDFPVRDKKLVLHIRRRRWLRPDGSSCVLDVYPRLVAKGTRFSEEFAGFLKKNLDTTPVTARSVGNTYHVYGDNLERSYKYHLSDYSTWVQKDHAGDWILVPDNIGEHLCIDETLLQDDLFTILSNKAGHGHQGTIISMVRGTKACEVIKVLIQIPEEDRLKVKEVTLDTSESMRSIVEQVFPNALTTLDCFHII